MTLLTSIYPSITSCTPPPKKKEQEKEMIILHPHPHRKLITLISPGQSHFCPRKYPSIKSLSCNHH